MKYSLCFILMVFLSGSVFSQQGVRIEEDFIEISFNSTMDADDLELIRSNLQERKIELNYEETTFYKNGKLSSISFKVDCRDGFSGSASRKFLTKNSRFGFQRDYAKGVKYSFRTGSL